MKTPRNVKRSFFDAIEDILEGSAFSPAYTCYYESDLREGSKPDFPWIYLLDADITFPAERLPVISVWISFGWRALQLGGPELWHSEVTVDIYARNRGEREDLAAAIAEGISDSFTIYDYSGGSPATWGAAEMHDNPAGDFWTVVYQSVGDPESVEGTRLNWASCASQFWCVPS